MHEVGGDRAGRRKEVEEIEAKIGFSISMYQVYSWASVMNLFQ